jgi:glycosyltransferase involved in cell wall biosynthesis
MRHLTIMGVGYAQSPHVASRLRCFAERGHTVLVITESATATPIPGVTQLVPSLEPSIVSSPWFRAAWWLVRHFADIGFDHVWRLFAFIRFLRNYKPDIVHVHFAYAYYAWIAGIVGCRPLVVSVMGGDVLFEEQGAPTPIGKWLTMNLLRRADFITAKSQYLVEAVERVGGDRRKTERIIWGIPVRRFGRVDPSELRQRLGIPDGHQVVLSPRILQPLYRQHLIVQAMSQVVAARPNTCLLLTEYGADPEYRDAIRQQITELGLQDNVRFCGSVPQAEMPAFYSLADMAVSVPSSDGLPQTLLEAMACGTPTILNDLSRYEEIVQHAQTAYFASATPDGIAQAVLELLGDSDMRERIARGGQTIVEREADIEEQACRVEEHYVQLVRSVRRRAFDPGHMLATWRRYRRFRASSDRSM